MHQFTVVYCLQIWTFLHHNTQPVLIFNKKISRILNPKWPEKVTWFHSFGNYHFDGCFGQNRFIKNSISFSLKFLTQNKWHKPPYSIFDKEITFLKEQFHKKESVKLMICCFIMGPKPFEIRFYTDFHKHMAQFLPAKCHAVR